MKKYYGSDIIVKIEKVGSFKTQSGELAVNVILEDEKGGLRTELVTEWCLETFSTDKKTDATELRDGQTDHIVTRLITVLLDYDFNMSGIGKLLDEMGNRLDASMERAYNFAWNKDDKKWAPQVRVGVMRKLLEGEKIIKSIPNGGGVKKEKN